MVSRMMQELSHPPFEVVLWTGEVVRGRASEPVARVSITSASALVRLALDPHLQFGELYSSGDLAVEGDLPDFLVELYIGVFREGGRMPWPRAVAERLHRARSNSLEGARENIQQHYDLGNAFYSRWLGPTMAYTCAYYEDPAGPLDQAQVAKMDHICRKLRLRPGETLVEAGCGWGSFALHAARTCGVRVRAFNISREQIAYARQQAREAGLEAQVEFLEDDYRNIAGRHDAFVSIGMLEHVGVENFPALGEVLHRSLTPSGRGLIHTIGRTRPQQMNPWVERRIFPGARPPSLGEMMAIFEAREFAVVDVENLRLHYARTLGHWLERFDASQACIESMFDRRFVRMWRLYLAGSIASFRTGDLQLYQVLFTARGCDDVSWTRAHLYGR
jgi:cyclopropane-fatty-acyl-phospholipid synthase